MEQLSKSPRTSYVVEYNVGTALLNLDAGAGNINFNDAVGSQTTLGGLTITSANNVTAASSIAADSLTQLVGTGTTTLQNVQTTAASGINLATNTIPFSEHLAHSLTKI